MQVFKAILRQDIEYYNGRSMVRVLKNTTIFVDKACRLALIDGVHIDIFDHEYTLLH